MGQFDRDGQRILGSAIAALHHTGSGASLAATARNFTVEVSSSQTDAGKVNLYSGNESGLFPARNLTQTKDGGLFGRSLEGCDVNNDGPTNSLLATRAPTVPLRPIPPWSTTTGRRRATTGQQTTPLPRSFRVNCSATTLRAWAILDGDGYDEHIISEPFNSTSGAFGAGALWLFEGTSGQLSVAPTGSIGRRPTAASAKRWQLQVTSTRTATTTFTSPVEWGTLPDGSRFSSVQPRASVPTGSCWQKGTPANISVSDWLLAAMSTGTG